MRRYEWIYCVLLEWTDHFFLGHWLSSLGRRGLIRSWLKSGRPVIRAFKNESFCGVLVWICGFKSENGDLEGDLSRPGNYLDEK